LSPPHKQQAETRSGVFLVSNFNQPAKC